MPCSSSPGLGIEDQARAVLRHVLQPGAEVRGAVPVIPANCPNCDTPTSSTKTPYCGTSCRNLSAFIRQFRGALEDGQIFDEERQVGLGQVFWYLVGGGRPLRQHIIPDRTVKDLFKKASGLCAICGAPGTQIDHIASGCNRPINLRITCDACCRTKPFGAPAVLNFRAVSALRGRVFFADCSRRGVAFLRRSEELGLEGVFAEKAGDKLSVDR